MSSSITRAIEAQKAKKAAANKRNAANDEYADSLGVQRTKGFDTMAPGFKMGEALTGTNIKEVGEERKGVRDRYKSLMEGPSMAEDVMGRKEQAAEKRMKGQQMAGNVAGGSAVAAEQQLGRQFAADTAKASHDEYIQNLGAYDTSVRGAASDIAKMGGQFGAVEVGMIKPPSQSSGGGATVICTELHRQGYFSDEIYAVDVEYGIKVRREDPLVYIGYRFWADPVVKLMKKYKWATKFAAYPCMKAINHVAGNKSILGYIILTVGYKMCGILGKMLGERHENGYGIKRYN